tara:strand:+ start:72 stop:644 length:573 start_codon:yes stop_codon:yes gene_type:complete
MKLKDYLEKQLISGKLTWNSKSELIRASGNNINGYNNKILEEYKSKFKFGSSLEIKNNEIKKYFNSLKDGSFVNVTGAVIKIQEQLPENISISETVIYNRLADKTFNVKKLKPQTLDNQVSKTELYDVKITKEFAKKIEELKQKGVYLYIEKTQRGGNTLRLKMFKNNKMIDKSFPPNNKSLEEIKSNYL